MRTTMLVAKTDGRSPAWIPSVKKRIILNLTLKKKGVILLTTFTWIRNFQTY
jgi:hypothetical protein